MVIIQILDTILVWFDFCYFHVYIMCTTWNTCYLFKIWLSYILLKYTLNMWITLIHIKGQSKLITRPLCWCEAKCSWDNFLTLPNIHNHFFCIASHILLKGWIFFNSLVHIIPHLSPLLSCKVGYGKIRNNSVNASPTACMIRLLKFHAWKTSVKIYIIHQYCSE